MDQIGEFQHFLRLKGQEESTIRTNTKLIRRVLTDCSPLMLSTFSNMVNGLIIQKKSVKYIRQIITITRYFAEFTHLKDLIDFRMPKLRDKSTYIRGTLSDEEIDSFINLSCPYSSRFTPVWKQWSMFWTVQAYTGMRPAEVSRLRVTDIDFGLGKINVLETKTGYPREIPISPMIRSSLEKYVKALCHDLLFPTSRDKTVPVSPSAWLENFNIRKRILKLNRPHLSAYSLRHSFASRLISETSIYDVKTLMGHRKISTTEKYLHTNLKRLQKTIDSDPLGERYKSPQDQFHDILKQENVLSEKYFENIHSQVSISEDGSEILIKRKIKHINFP